MEGNDKPQFRNLINFLETLNKHSLLDQINFDSKVVYADDQFANQHSVMRNFEELGINDKLVTFSNGQDVIDHIEKVLSKVKTEDDQVPCQPIALLLLDIGMPILDGFETLKKAKELFERENRRIASHNLLDKQLYIMRPTICFFSQFDRQKFVHFFTDEEQPEFFLEKPLAQEELASLLKLIRVL